MRYLSALLAAGVLASSAAAQGIQGYYRHPAIHHDTIVFVSEGDLWRVPASGGRAIRLTTHAGEESTPAISPDGQTIAFTAQYEGPIEVYTMPLDGGLPTRRTWDANPRASVQGWTSDGLILAATERFSTVPNVQLYTLDPRSGERRLLPLSQASDGCFTGPARDSTLIFTRLHFNGSYTKRYRGGTTQNLWKFGPNLREAVPLTADYDGTSKRPMVHDGRVYFLTDRDGTMNLWSMDLDGKDLRQHTRHKGMDIGGAGGNTGASLHNGRIVYQHGADLRLYDIASGEDRLIPITLASDLDQTRERWIKKPMDYATAIYPSPNGDRVVITARGRVFVFPHRQGRIVEAGRDEGVRYRNARFMPDGKTILALSDKSGEVELWTLPANGVGEPVQLTHDADVLRWDAIPSPDGRYIVHHDKKLRVWVYDTREKTNVKIDDLLLDETTEFEWSTDSRYLAYVAWADNMFRVIKIWSAESGQVTQVTTDRFDSYSPAFSPDGQWLYFLSDRDLKTVVPSPWGPNQPDPFLDKTTKVYQLALQPGLRSPFQPKDELHQAEDKKKEERPEEKKPPEPRPTEQPDRTPELPVKPELPPKKPDQPTQPPKNPASQPEDIYKPSEKPAPADTPEKPASEERPEKRAAADRPAIDFDGIMTRLHEVPIPSGNYDSLFVNDKALFWTSFDRADRSKRTLHALAITNDPIEIKQVAADLRSVIMTNDGKKFMIRRGDNLYIIDAAAAPASDLDKKAVNLSGWMLSIIPREEWRQMFTEAWRLERDYFYDPDMHGVNWPAMREKYAPLVDRVASRAELSDVLAHMIGELSALHMFVRGGDLRQGEDQIAVGFLGALLERDEGRGGYRITRIFRADPDDPHLLAPLARPGVDAKEGDVITMINGVPTLSLPDPHMLLRNQAGKQVLIRIKPAPQAAGGPDAEPAERDAIVVPITQAADADLRYHDWEYSRRKLVEEWSGGRIGYLHLRAMGGANFTEFVRGFYPAFNREGLIIDVRHNRGGNIDSWILSKLMRKAWFYWTQRFGNPPTWNMQYAFRGHMVALCNERTASDGEAFAEGFRRLGLGKVIGTRTWGGEIWLSSSNVLVDRGIATAAESGVYGPEGQWLIEGRGVEPDIVVDNLPHATFNGEDAQLRAAVDHLLERIRQEPVPPVQRPAFPNKAIEDNRR